MFVLIKLKISIRLFIFYDFRNRIHNSIYSTKYIYNIRHHMCCVSNIKCKFLWDFIFILGFFDHIRQDNFQAYKVTFYQWPNLQLGSFSFILSLKALKLNRTVTRMYTPQTTNKYMSIEMSFSMYWILIQFPLYVIEIIKYYRYFDYNRIKTSI